MKIKDLPIMWVEAEIKLQEKALNKLEEATHFNNVSGFNKVIDMRKQFLSIAKENLLNLTSRI